jgi:hypothetical protein
MKLYELKAITPPDLIPKRIPVRSFDKTDMFSMVPKNGVRIGNHGVQASAFTTDNEPGTATKIIRDAGNLKSDAYFKYVSTLAKNDRISKNPYFPKIYGVNIKDDKNGRARYSVEMERLLDFNSLSMEEMYMLGDKMFFNFYAFAKDARARMRDDLGKIDAKMQSAETASFAIMKAMERVIKYRAKVETYIKDPNLKGALLILKSLIKNDSGVNPDIHTGNIMVRRGPGGPQLVITDPVI